MISPLGRGHIGGTLSITSSRGSSGVRSRHTRVGASCGCRGPTATEPAEGPVAAGPATTGPTVEGPTTEGLGPWRTCGLKE